MSIPITSKCLVTGASDPQSIGYACAKALLKAGAAQVCIMARGEDEINSAIASLLEQELEGHQSLHGVVGDLKQPETMASVIAQAVEKMGGLDILIVSGGNGNSEYLGLDANDLASYQMMHNVGVMSPLFLAESAMPALQKSEAGGAVVMVSSMAPLVPWPDTAPFNYAKAAQNCMVETLAFKYRTSNVRINAVLPACIHTGALDRMAKKKNAIIDEYAKLRADAHPMGRNGTPEDVANAVIFLSSPASAFTTGELLQVDGGLHLSNWFNKPKIMNEFVGGEKAS
jgi:NAD(P)-dependent dehydrogenase (short-subunit alcohol dehydrogenase family)